MSSFSTHAAHLQVVLAHPPASLWPPSRGPSHQRTYPCCRIFYFQRASENNFLLTCIGEEVGVFITLQTYFSKILYKYYGAELVVSEKHRSGALFHFKELSSQKGGGVCQKHGNRRRVSKKGGARQMKKFSSGRKKGTVMSMSSLKSSVRRYHVTFKPKRPRKSR